MSTPSIIGKPKAAPDYPYAQPPAPATLQTVAPGVFWVRMPLPLALDHINLWLLADGAGWTLVDTGYATDAAKAAWTALLPQATAGRTLKRLVVTHCHPDHIGLAAWLCERHGLVPWMTQSEYLLAHAAYERVAGTEISAMLELGKRHGLDAARLAAIQSREDQYRRGVDGLPAAFRRIADGNTIRIDGNAWRVIVGRGHSPEHAALYCDALGVLIAGDMVLPRITTNVSVWPMEPEADPLGDFLESLARLRALPEDTLVLPSHGLPFRGLRGRIDELIAHHDERLARLERFCSEPRSAAEAMPGLFTRPIDDHHLFFALGETIAHLNYLMHRDRVARRPGNHGEHRFAATTDATRQP